MATSKTTRVVIILTICALLTLHIVWLAFVCDDAFISFRYAKNLVDGQGMVFNAGERVEGYTNFLWVLVSALILAFGGDPARIVPWIGGAAIVLTVGVILWHRSGRNRDYIFSGLLVATNGGVAAWATGGLETGLFTALITAAFSCLAYALDDETNGEAAKSVTGRHPAGRTPLLLSAVILLPAALTRPEGVLITGLTGFFLLALVIRRQLTVSLFATWAGLWLIPYAVYFVWRYTYFGHVFPNTYYVKASAGSMTGPGLEYLGLALQRFCIYLIALPAVVLVLMRRPLGSASRTTQLGAVIILPYLAYVVSVGGDFMDMFRFIVPIIPMTMLILGPAWRELSTVLSERFSRVGGVAAVSLLMIVTSGWNLHSSWDTQKVWYRHGLDSIGLLRRYREDWTLLAQQLRSVSQPTDSIAITAAGIIPYYTNLYTIDQLGLIAPDLSLYATRPQPRPGHQRLLKGEALYALRPQFILGHPSITSGPGAARTALYIEDAWFDRVTTGYRTLGVQLSEFPPRYTAYVVRKDITSRVPGRER